MLYFLILPLLFVTISMAVNPGNEEVLLPLVKNVANVSLRDRVLSNPLNFVSSLNKADPVEVNKVIVLIDGLISTGEGERENARNTRDNKQEALNTASANLDTATEEHNDVAGQLILAKEALEEATQEVTRLIALEAEKKAAKDARVVEQATAQEELVAAQQFLDNEIIRIDAERSILLQIKQLLADLNVQEGEWFLVYKQTVPFFTDVESWKHLGSPSEENYSILDELETYRSADGKFHFKIVWPNMGGRKFNEWRQTSNPVTSSIGSISGYEAVNVAYTFHGFGGLVKSEQQAHAFLDGTPGNGNWCYAVATVQQWGVGVPAHCQGGDASQTVVELFVMKDN